MTILHITTWYPSTPTPNSAPFIKNQIDALSLHSENIIWHLEIKKGRFNVSKGVNNDSSRYWIMSLPFEVSRIKEWVSFWMVLWLLLKEDVKKYDIINFHIAYPNLIYWHFIKRWIRIPIVINEHWSAYHFNFGVKKQLPRVQNIFQQNIPVIAVSKALVNDIRSFSLSKFPYYVVPNVVNNSLFYPDQNITRKPFYFMVSQWNPPKDPFIIMESFRQLNKNEYSLIIGGHGTQWNDMKLWIEKHNLSDKIKLLGELNSNDIANYMRTCTAFLHSSKYETFSVVCAEALTCGTPIIASNVGGIPEVLGNYGILIDGFNVSTWKKALNEVDKQPENAHLKNRFSPETIGNIYYNSILEILNDNKR